MADQVKNGKAFEYAIARIYFETIKNKGLQVSLTEDDAYNTAKKFFEESTENQQNRHLLSAKATLDTMFKIEPGLTAQKDKNDILNIRIAKDKEGQDGDVRDIIFIFLCC